MCDEFLGPMPVRAFFDAFLACDAIFDAEDLVFPLTAVDLLPTYRHMVERKIVRIQCNIASRIPDIFVPSAMPLTALEYAATSTLLTHINEYLVHRRVSLRKNALSVRSTSAECGRPREALKVLFRPSQILRWLSR